ncbi:hypothetical protein BDV26DRAFT_172670 [Aspergillus bertholletiae]|uniref:Uncharacterized protein n=1 Tax=Aspergillus bertholletiae TaxID=1226010 RepID=A0A5N7BBP4_9EURO|nr:hypothetical protein BDV26DRAFT_172670 [Aspergillus bertholletiae]
MLLVADINTDLARRSKRTHSSRHQDTPSTGHPFIIDTIPFVDNLRYPLPTMFALLFLLLGVICPTLAHPVPRATLNRLYRRGNERLWLSEARSKC